MAKSLSKTAIIHNKFTYTVIISVHYDLGSILHDCKRA